MWSTSKAARSVNNDLESLPISVADVDFCYGAKKIYENLSLEVMAGQRFGLLGKNGVGKSTLINLLMGYLAPQKGECRLFGQKANRLDVQTKRRVALLFEGFVTYDTLSIRNLEQFYSSFYPNWKSKYFVQLLDLMDVNVTQKVGSLSFGQRSQVVLGLLLAQDADLLILDDYSLGLDAGYRRLFIDYLDDYLANTSKAVLLTTHVMDDLESFIDSFAIVDRSTEVFQSDMGNFNKCYRCYQINDNTSIDEQSKNAIKLHPMVHRYEHYRGKHFIYSFRHLTELHTELQVNLVEVPMTFEARFLGFVGKY